MKRKLSILLSLTVLISSLPMGSVSHAEEYQMEEVILLTGRKKQKQRKKVYLKTATN